ncbi:MAG TPA: response regulator [Pirellulaceae bacterium]|nr:response regulator [Pirellulaceae bacterium]
MTAATPLTVLLVEDRESDAQLILSELCSAGFDPAWTRVETEAEYLAGLARKPDLILFDCDLPHLDAHRGLQLRDESGVDIPLIVVSASSGEDMAVRAMQEGAADYLVKDRLVRLGQAVAQALAQKKLRDAKRVADQALQEQLRLAALTADIGLAQTASDSLSGVLARCAESLARNLRAALARIWILDEQHQVLDLLASAGDSAGDKGPPERVAIGRSCVGLIAERQLPYLTNDVVNDSCFDELEWARQEGLTAFAGYPLLVEDRPVGVMALFGRQSFPQATLDAMAAVANHIALGIERKRAEEALHLTERRLRHLVSSTPAVSFALRVEGDTCIPAWVSQSVERLTGYEEPEALQPQWWQDHVHPEDLPHAQAFLPALLTQANFAAEYRFRCLSGEYRWLLDQKRLVRDGQGNPQEIVGSWLDITERKRLEEQFRQAQKLEAIGRLAGGVAHDFNNLLTVIIGYSELILETFQSDDPLRKFVEEIIRAGVNGASLTRQLLAFSRRQLLVSVVVDFNDLLAKMEKMLSRLIEEDIDLVIRPAPGLWPIRVDSGQMEQVVMNLVVNARDAMPNGGKLTIETDNVVLDDMYVRVHPQARKGEHVRICVSDNGCGMDAATRARIFEPFFTTKKVDEGTGLGLPTVYGIVAQSGGHIGVYSEPGLGTTFRIYIPRDSGDVPQAPFAAKLPSQSRGTETVLLVEDAEHVRSLARLALQKKGYQVLEAGHPHEALRMLETFPDPVHILVTDVVMPAMSGRQLAERLAADWPGMKVLFISGYTDDAVMRHGILEKGTPFLQKPFTPDALAQKVREVLDQAG